MFYPSILVREKRIRIKLRPYNGRRKIYNLNKKKKNTDLDETRRVRRPGQFPEEGPGQAPGVPTSRYRLCAGYR